MYTLTTTVGVFNLTGNSVNTLKGFKTSENTGVFNLTGVSNKLVKGNLCVASTGSFVVDGKSIVTKAVRKISAGKGIFNLTGISVKLNKGPWLTASKGIFNLTGVDTGLRKTHNPLVASTGSFLVNGRIAGLYKEGLFAGVGEYNLNGLDSPLQKGFRLLTSPGSFNTSGVNVSYYRTYKATNDTSTFILNIPDFCSLRRNRVKSHSPGSFALTGNNVVLSRSRSLNAEKGNFVLIGKRAICNNQKEMEAGVGSFSIAADGDVAIRQVPLLLFYGNGYEFLHGFQVSSYTNLFKGWRV